MKGISLCISKNSESLYYTQNNKHDISVITLINHRKSTSVPKLIQETILKRRYHSCGLNCCAKTKNNTPFRLLNWKYIRNLSHL